MVMGRPSKLLTIDEACQISCPVVYALCDLDGSEFYVGRTVRPRSRFRAHARGSKDNSLLRAKVKSLGCQMRVRILHSDPGDIKAAERVEIAKRFNLLNLIGGNHWSWSKHASAPWSLGNKALCPSDYAANRMRRDVGKEYRRRVAGLSCRDRSRYEIALLVSLPDCHAAPLVPWAKAVAPKLLAAAECR